MVSGGMMTVTLAKAFFLPLASLARTVSWQPGFAGAQAGGFGSLAETLRKAMEKRGK